MTNETTTQAGCGHGGQSTTGGSLVGDDDLGHMIQDVLTHAGDVGMTEEEVLAAKQKLEEMCATAIMLELWRKGLLSMAWENRTLGFVSPDD